MNKGRRHKLVQCLYCEADLKSIRGLFDEDFCCRDHREKYFASFRKAISRLPVFETPAPSEPSPAAEASSVTPREIPAEAAPCASEPDDPPIAEFLEIPVTLYSVESAPRSAREEVFSASRLLETPDWQTDWGMSLEGEEGFYDPSEPAPGIVPPAGVADPVEFTISRADVLELDASADAVLEAVELEAWSEFYASAGEMAAKDLGPLACLAIGLALPSLTLASEPTVLPEGEASELRLKARHLISAPVMLSELPLEFGTCLPRFAASAEPLQSEAELESIPDQNEPESIPDQMAFPWSREDADAGPAPAGEGSTRPQEPEIAPAIVLASAPVDSASSSPSNLSQAIPPAFELASEPAGDSAGPLSAPTLPAVDAEPGIEPEPAPDQAANPPAAPRSHEPLRPSFGSSVRIKNWRLKITFAKPA